MEDGGSPIPVPLKCTLLSSCRLNSPVHYPSIGALWSMDNMLKDFLTICWTHKRIKESKESKIYLMNTYDLKLSMNNTVHAVSIMNKQTSEPANKGRKINRLSTNNWQSRLKEYVPVNKCSRIDSKTSHLECFLLSTFCAVIACSDISHFTILPSHLSRKPNEIH